LFISSSLIYPPFLPARPLQADLELKGVLKRLLPLTMSTLHGQLDRYFTLLKHYLESQASV